MIRTTETITITLALLLGLGMGLPAQAEKPGPPQGSPEQKQTIQDIRDVGTAMYAWYKAEMAPRRSAEAHHKAEEAARDPQTASLGDVPAISREELTKILVPKYLQQIPSQDGWGNPYEFHLNTSDPDALHVMGLRSAGQDGRFSPTPYEIGAFSSMDQDQDIAWMDGYFIRWPQVK
jgi:hypothetical protein